MIQNNGVNCTLLNGVIIKMHTKSLSKSVSHAEKRLFKRLIWYWLNYRPEDIAKSTSINELSTAVEGEEWYPAS